VWREVFGRTIARLEIEPLTDGPLMAEASLVNLPNLGIMNVASADLRFHKPPSLIDSDDIVLTTVDSGTWIGVQGRREARVQPGDAALVDCSVVAGGTALGRRTMLRVPVKALAPLVPDLHAITMQRIPGDSEPLRLLRQYLRVMREMESLATPPLQRLASTHIFDLLAVTLGATREAAEVAGSRGVRAARLRAIKDDIAGNLEHGEVSVGSVALRHRVSARYVQKLFDAEGTTFSEYVLGARLAHAHRLLSDPRRHREKVATIALTAGFGDVSYFYRAFRRRYGMLPTDVRAQARRDHLGCA
jgi:AraC-like DNA-binding protein